MRHYVALGFVRVLYTIAQNYKPSHCVMSFTKTVSTIGVGLTMAVSATTAVAHEWDTSRPDSHAPIDVMGDHTHNEGEWMFSYRAMYMQMDGNQTGTKKVSTDRVLEDFMVSPIKMDMTMHMFGAMYASSDDLTWALMIPYLDMTMDHVTRMGAEFRTETSGIGDIKAQALYKVMDNGRDRFHFNFGTSFPTGSINEDGITPMGKVVLPYPMQLGSGTYDLMPGFTYSALHDDFSFGAQFIATLRTGTNNRGYRLGNRYKAQSWFAVPFASWVSGSIRLAYDYWGDINGQDKRLNPAVIPTARTDLRGGQMFSGAIGFNFVLPVGNRLALEYTAPVYQDLNGPQLATEQGLTFGWQLSL
ncbi:Uncharacterised protein [BD1-7 clade bacterium]|uniref:Alpha-amylase n=1 Tax=BD1-7 clade bacterium TaxID=2029982 RepID=A0A5S9QEF5_9GAMM|nr:Uncharacterised protein [BD1-7 clade bacterium]